MSCGGFFNFRQLLLIMERKHQLNKLVFFYCSSRRRLVIRVLTDGDGSQKRVTLGHIPKLPLHKSIITQRLDATVYRGWGSKEALDIMPPP